MRVGEANSLRIRDVIPFRDAKERSNYRFVVRGKTGERDVILRSAAARRVGKMLAKREDEDPNSYLFNMSGGAKIITLTDQLNAALRKAKLRRTALGKSTACIAFVIFTLLRPCVVGLVFLKSPVTWVLRSR